MLLESRESLGKHFKTVSFKEASPVSVLCDSGRVLWQRQGAGLSARGHMDEMQPRHSTPQLSCRPYLVTSQSLSIYKE